MVNGSSRSDGSRVIYPVRSKRAKPFARRLKKRSKKLTRKAADDNKLPTTVPAGVRISEELNTGFSDISAPTMYNWLKEVPSERVGPLSHSISRRCGLLPLSKLCANTIAENSNLLHSSYLDNWRTWRIVWELILSKGLDSPYLFAIFANKFKSEETFSCHATALEDGIISGKFKHRLLNLGANISHKSLSTFVYENKFNLLLDLSLKSNGSNGDLMFQMANLTALDLSNLDDIDNSFLKRLCCAINDNPDKFSSLKVLVLLNCRNITSDGALEFMLGQNCINYIETDHILVDLKFPMSFANSEKVERYAYNSKYKYLEDECKILVKLPLGMKLFGLSERYPIQLQENRVLLDVVISNDNYTTPNTKRNILTRTGHCYFKDDNRMIEVDEKPKPKPHFTRPTKFTPQIFKMKSRKILLADDKPNTKRSKPITQKANVNKFFDIT